MDLDSTKKLVTVLKILNYFNKQIFEKNATFFYELENYQFKKQMIVQKNHRRILI